MRFSLPILIFLIATLTVSSQDVYHQELLEQLSTEYNIENPSYVFFDTESANIETYTIYGNSSIETTDISDFSFSRRTTISVNSVGANKWDSGFGSLNKKTINKDDIVLFAFWAKKNSEASDLAVFIEDNNTFEKEIYTDISFTQDWTQYFIAFKSSKNYSVGKMKFGFHLAGAIQEFEVAGFTALNFDSNYTLDEVPSIYNPSKYGGYEEDAPWRSEAAARIDLYRKANLTVNVIDLNGNPVNNADVSVEMTKHDFGFGTAVVACRFPGNDCFNQTYVQKMLDLDGNNNTFNIAVTENALKWDGWEEEWIGSPAETRSAISYLDNAGIEVRGHTLIWPGWNNLPSDMVQNSTNQEYLKTRVMGRIESMLNDEILGEIITEWDVLNEITTNRDLEYSFATLPDYETGRELYVEIFDKVQELKPNHVNYINDYVTLSNGGFGESTTNRYKQFVGEIASSGVKLDGIGFQAHIGAFPTSIYKIEETLNEFVDAYDVDLKITEYDIDDKVEPEVQAKYLRDFLTMIFSQERMTAFLMWGFWDGNHWKGNAPMFDKNWNLKPSGEAFNDLVFNEWWTNEEGSTDGSGKFATRVFKGNHNIIVRINGVEVLTEAIVNEDEEITVSINPSFLEAVEYQELILSPNPTKGQFTIETEDNILGGNLIITDISGKVVYVDSNLTTTDVNLNLSAGTFIVKIKKYDNNYITRLIIH